MDNKKLPPGLFCQSCGIPFDAEDDMGTNSDGSRNTSYCKFCFSNGAFVEPDITAEQMVDKLVELMKHIDGSEEAKIREMAQSFIPNLERWSGAGQEKKKSSGKKKKKKGKSS